MKQNYSPQRRRKWWLFTSALVKSVNYICILVGSFLWSIRGETHWRRRTFFFLPILLCKTGFRLPWVCSIVDHGRRQKVIRTSVTHSCATFLFCRLLRSSVAYYWTDAWQHEINLFKKLTLCAKVQDLTIYDVELQGRVIRASCHLSPWFP